MKNLLLAQIHDDALQKCFIFHEENANHERGNRLFIYLLFFRDRSHSRTAFATTEKSVNSLKWKLTHVPLFVLPSSSSAPSYPEKRKRGRSCNLPSRSRPIRLEKKEKPLSFHFQRPEFQGE